MIITLYFILCLVIIAGIILTISTLIDLIWLTIIKIVREDILRDFLYWYVKVHRKELKTKKIHMKDDH